MKRRLTLILAVLLLAESCALGYVAVFTRVIWRRDGPNWVYRPRSSEVTVWQDKGNEVFLVASDRSGFGGESFAHVDETGGDRFITIQLHSDHLETYNMFKNGANGVDFIDNAGSGIPNQKLVRTNGILRRYVHGEISWHEAMPNQSTDPTLSSGTPAAGQPARHP
jgi:hypothetical protein